MESGLEKKKYPYPKSIPFILTTEFCERFAYYGMRAILTLFVNQVLGYSETNASVLFHGFTVLAYITPIFGAILADSYIGKFKTIFYVSIIYGIGQLVVTLASVGNTEDGNQGISGLPTQALILTGLFLVGVGTGGIKPCVATFGGEQFKLPEQKQQCETFFSIFYWAVNLGSFVSMLVTPQLRSNVACLGQEYCYPLAFAVPAALMFLAIGAFIIGRVCNMYNMVLPNRDGENIMKKTIRCLWKGRFGSKVDGETHWIDRGQKEFGEKFVDDTKAVWNVCVMMVTFPIFWALFDQQGSRWTFQATRMDGNFFGLFRIQPDNMQVANALMILIMVPIFTTLVYPFLGKCNLLKTNLQRIFAGFILAGLSFTVSGVLELQLETTYPHLPPTGQGQLIAYYNLPSDIDLCNITLSDVDCADGGCPVLSAELFHSEVLDINIGSYNVRATECLGTETYLGIFLISEGESTSINIHSTEGKIEMTQSYYDNAVEKPSGGKPSIKVIWSDLNELFDSPPPESAIILKNTKDINNEEKWGTFNVGSDLDFGDTEVDQVPAVGQYQVFFNDVYINAIVDLKQGANYNIQVIGSQNITLLHQVTGPNTVSMFWQIPQYIIMTAGEVLFSITTMEFCFTQAPVEMKAVMLGMRYMTNAVGNLIDIFVMKAFEGVLPSQAYEFFLFSALTLVCAVIFALQSKGYKYVDYTK